MYRLLNLLGLFMVFMGCSQTTSKQEINQFLKEDHKGVVLVDVRTPEEYKAGHLETAENINLFASDFEQEFAKIDKDETIYLYCKVGGRSAEAQKKLLALGYKSVINLEGGYDAVAKANK